MHLVWVNALGGQCDLQSIQQHVLHTTLHTTHTTHLHGEELVLTGFVQLLDRCEAVDRLLQALTKARLALGCLLQLSRSLSSGGALCSLL